MPHPEVARLREELRKELFEIAKKMGPTYPLNRVDVERFEVNDQEDFAKLYPNLETLCHYTTADGLRGILETSSLYATNVEFLNDPEEFRFAGCLVCRGKHRRIRPEFLCFTSLLRGVSRSVHSFRAGGEVVQEAHGSSRRCTSRPCPCWSLDN